MTASLRTPRPARPLLAALAFAFASIALPQTAAADEEGGAGRVNRIRINTPSSDEHPSFHGALVLKQPGGDQVEYRWGGSSCPGQKLTDVQVDVLVSAFVERNRTMVTPRYTMGEGAGTRCLVGFELVAG